jgi:ankyrin repeat protein/tetratricopeptide repeat protein
MQPRIPKLKITMNITETEAAAKKSRKRIYNQTRDSIVEGRLASLKMTADQLAALRDHRNRSLLSLAASKDCLNRIVGGVTADQLDQSRDDDGVSALIMAAMHGCLYQIKGGVTADQLAAHVSSKFSSALYLAAKRGHLDQIVGEITLAQLKSASLPNGDNGLIQAAFNGQMDLIAGGVTVDDLKSTKSKDGRTPLHHAACQGHLDQISGGVTFEQLCDPPAIGGDIPIFWAVLNGHIDQIKGRVTIAQMTGIKLANQKTLLDLAGRSGHLLQVENAKYPNIGRVPSTAAEIEDYTSWVCEPTFEGFETFTKTEKRIHLRLLARLRSEYKMFGRANFMLAVTYGTIGLDDEALACARQAVALMPKDAEAFNLLGQILYKLARMNAALAALQRSFDLGRRVPQLLITLALIKSDLAHPVTELEALLKLAAEVHPDEPEIWQATAAILEAIGKHAESDRAHERYVQLVAPIFYPLPTN